MSALFPTGTGGLASVSAETTTAHARTRALLFGPYRRIVPTVSDTLNCVNLTVADRESLLKEGRSMGTQFFC